MSNRVLRFSPPAQKQNDVSQAIYGTERDLLDESYSAGKQIFDDGFVKTAGVTGIKKYEKLLGIKVGQNETIEHRRQIVLQKLAYRPPYTRQTLGEMLKTLWGEGNYVYEIIPNEFQLIVDITTDDPESYLQFQHDLRRNIPANMSLTLLIQYIHAYLKKNYTYGEMHRRFTYGELSRYANIQGVKHEL